jgi:hypothetical protein
MMRNTVVFCILHLNVGVGWKWKERRNHPC